MGAPLQSQAVHDGESVYLWRSDTRTLPMGAMTVTLEELGGVLRKYGWHVVSPSNVIPRTGR